LDNLREVVCLYSTGSNSPLGAREIHAGPEGILQDENHNFLVYL
jgi:hypothetical protein